LLDLGEFLMPLLAFRNAFEAGGGCLAGDHHSVSIVYVVFMKGTEHEREMGEGS
jgi:hypothetical protein